MDDHTRDDTPPRRPDRLACRRTLGTCHARRTTERGVRQYHAGEFHACHGCFENVWSSVDKSHRHRDGFERPATSL